MLARQTYGDGIVAPGLRAHAGLRSPGAGFGSPRCPQRCRGHDKQPPPARRDQYGGGLGHAIALQLPATDHYHVPSSQQNGEQNSITWNSPRTGPRRALASKTAGLRYRSGADRKPYSAAIRTTRRNWTICTRPCAQRSGRPPRQIRRSGTTPGSKSKSRWVTGLVGGLAPDPPSFCALVGNVRWQPLPTQKARSAFASKGRSNLLFDESALQSCVFWPSESTDAAQHDDMAAAAFAHRADRPEQPGRYDLRERQERSFGQRGHGGLTTLRSGTAITARRVSVCVYFADWCPHASEAWLDVVVGTFTDPAPKDHVTFGCRRVRARPGRTGVLTGPGGQTAIGLSAVRCPVVCRASPRPSPRRRVLGHHGLANPGVAEQVVIQEVQVPPRGAG